MSSEQSHYLLIAKFRAIASISMSQVLGARGKRLKFIHKICMSNVQIHANIRKKMNVSWKIQPNRYDVLCQFSCGLYTFERAILSICI